MCKECVVGDYAYCSNKCRYIKLMINNLVDKYAPVHGCENCWGDLHQGCTDKCREEFKLAKELQHDLYGLYKLITDDTKNIKR
jgi:hypothetical protein